MKLDKQFSRVTVILALALLVVTMVSTGCEDSGVNAPTDGNLILTPALAHIVILEGESSGSATFTAVTVFQYRFGFVGVDHQVYFQRRDLEQDRSGYRCIRERRGDPDASDHRS